MSTPDVVDNQDTHHCVTSVPTPPATENAGAQPSAPSASSALALNVNSSNGFSDATPRTVAKGADGSARAAVSTVRANPLKNHRETAADGADANITPRSDLGECKGAGWRGRL